MNPNLPKPLLKGVNKKEGETGRNLKRRVNLTPEVRQVFFKKLEECGLQIESARAAEVTVLAIHYALKRDPEFADRYDEAVAVYKERLQRETHRRAVDGVVKDIIVPRGTKTPMEIRQYSDRLLELMLKRHIPEYRDHVRVDQVSVNTGIDVEALLRNLPKEKRAKLRELLSDLSAAAGGSAADVHSEERGADPDVQSEVLDPGPAGGQPPDIDH